jgi:hypothetical protein
MPQPLTGAEMIAVPHFSRFLPREDETACVRAT